MINTVCVEIKPQEWLICVNQIDEQKLETWYRVENQMWYKVYNEAADQVWWRAVETYYFP